MIKHVAFIMDGNRRWAKDRKLLTLIGHAKGAENIERLVSHAKDRGIKHLTFWAFSTENWKREEKEVTYLMGLFRKMLRGTILKRILKNGGRIQILGQLDRFPEDIQKECARVLNASANNSDIIINIALNYGGRAEIMDAIKQLIKEGKKAEEITEDMISKHLYSSGQPDPDLIIRTGGEQRLSGYLPWQSIYSELYFTDIYWPDFDESAFDTALEEYANRERRFGK